MIVLNVDKHHRRKHYTPAYINTPFYTVIQNIPSFFSNESEEKQQPLLVLIAYIVFFIVMVDTIFMVL